MAEPVDFQIAERLQTALQGITAENGYYFDVASTAVKLDPNVEIDGLLNQGDAMKPLLLIEMLADQPSYFPDLQFVARLLMRVHWFGDSDPTEDASRLRTYLRACADIERAVVASLGFGGLAKDSRIVRRGFDSSDDGTRVWAVVDLEIGYERTYGAP